MGNSTLEIKSTNPRSLSIDAVRIVGIVAVIVGHVWPNGPALAWVYPWHVPLFFFLSGYFWKPARSIKAEIGKRFASLGRPYVAWFLVLFVALIATMALQKRFNWSWLLESAYGGAYATMPFSAFWFISVLFFATILYRAIERLPVWVHWGVAVAGLAMAATTGEMLGRTPLAVGLAFPCLIFILAGQYFRKCRYGIHAGPLVGGVLVAAGLALSVAGVSAQVSIKATNFGTPALGVTVAISICIGLVLLAETLIVPTQGWVANTISRLAATGTAAVLGHSGIIMFGLFIGPRNELRDLLTALIIPWAVGIVCLYTPLSRWVNGTPQVQRVVQPAVAAQ